MHFSLLETIEAMALPAFVVLLVVILVFALLELFRQSQMTKQSKLWIGTVLGVGSVGFAVKVFLHWVFM